MKRLPMIKYNKRGPQNRITEEEIEKIKSLQATNTIAEISKVLRRPVGTVARIVSPKKLKPLEVNEGVFDWKDFNNSVL